MENLGFILTCLAVFAGLFIVALLCAAVYAASSDGRLRSGKNVPATDPEQHSSK